MRIPLGVGGDLVEIARDRGYVEMEALLTSRYASLHDASSKGEPVAAAIRERDPEKVRTLLDETPGLLHAGDGRSSQPIHWAVMTRQIDIIDDLLRRGANIDARRQDGAHPVELTNGDYFFRGWRDVPKSSRRLRTTCSRTSWPAARIATSGRPRISETSRGCAS